MSRLPHDWFDPCQLDDIVRVTVSNHGPATASAPWARTRPSQTFFFGHSPTRQPTPDKSQHSFSPTDVMSMPRNSDGNPDSPQVVVFLATIVDVTVGS